MTDSTKSSPGQRNNTATRYSTTIDHSPAAAIIEHITDSSAAASPSAVSMCPTIQKLDCADVELSDIDTRLDKVQDKLGELRRHAERLERESFYRVVVFAGKCIQRLSFNTLHVAAGAFYLARKAARIAKAAAKRDASLASLTAPQQHKTATAFHWFPRLPAELRLMVWTAAALPPSCMHYFGKFKLAQGGREPGAPFMDDRGLWTASWESRRVVQRAYAKKVADADALALAGVEASAGCSFASIDSEAQYRRLAGFNDRGDDFKYRMRTLKVELASGFILVEVLLRRQLSNRKDPEVIKIIKEVFEIGPGWKLGEDDVPVAALEKVRAELKDVYLS